MAAENEAYTEGTRLLRSLRALREDVNNLDASDTQCKERVLQQLDHSRERLQAALTELSGLV